VLWPFGTDGRASGNLRSALWRLNRADVDLITADRHYLRLRQSVVVDVHLVFAWAARLISGRHSYRDLRILPTPIDAFDLLPGWYDDWVLLARERLRQQVIGPVVARLAAAGDGCCSSRRRASPGGRRSA
jgi:DNA-binding SARP family transcriptional activator